MSKFHAGNGRNIVRASVAAAIGAASLIGFSTQAIAAEAGDDELLVDELAEVQVTGTRIQNNPNVTSANPITSVTGEEMRQLGIVNVADALTLLVPQNISSYMPGMTGDDQSGFGGGGMDSMDRGSFFVGQTIANLRGMDPAFGSRTLTMVDGRRMVSSSNQADVVDMNIIPSNLLQRMDVVTGGASATYGSGAMAGVVNLVLNNRMQGVNVDLSYGVNEAGDGSSPNVSISGGRSFFGGRGHGLLSLEWQDTSAIRDCAAARNWCAESRTLFTNSAGSTQDVTGVLNPLEGYQGLPARFEMANYRRQQFSPNGAVHHANSQLTSGYRFTDDGFGVEEYAYGYRGGTGQSALGGDGPLVTQDTVLRPSSERRTMFTNFEYNLTERTTAYLQANYSETESDNRNGYTTGTGALAVNAPAAAGPNGGIARATNVITTSGTPASIEMTFTGVPTVPTGATPLPETTTTLTFTEPNSIPGQMTGSWVSEDSRRFWVFDFDNTTGFHAGVNGPINVQDGCFVFDDAAAPTGYYTRRGGSTGCMTLSGQATTGGGGVRFIENYQTGFASIDFFAPSGNLTSAPPGFFGRFPGAQGAGDGRPPSPNLFEVIPGAPDTLVAQRTVNGTPFEPEHVFTRVTPKVD